LILDLRIAKNINAFVHTIAEMIPITKIHSIYAIDASWKNAIESRYEREFERRRRIDIMYHLFQKN
jgi:hypothetical protein